ncbi:autotransporter outer membrane beta-barrel domain-containing protein [Citrobacter sedlakii]
MNISFKPNKVALFVSAILSSAVYSAAAAPVSTVIDASTASDKRTVILPDGNDVSFVDVRVADGRVILTDNSVITSAGNYPDDSLTFNPGYIVKATAGTVDLGNNATLNYTFDYQTNGNKRGTAIYIYGTGVLKAENLTINAENTRVNDYDLVNAILLNGSSQADLKGTTNIVLGNIETAQDSILTAENVNINYHDANPLSTRGHHAALDLAGKTSTFTGDVHVAMSEASTGSLEGINIGGNSARFDGKTVMDLASAKGSVSGLKLTDSYYRINVITGTKTPVVLSNAVTFEDLTIAGVSHGSASDNGRVVGLHSASVEGDTQLSIKKLTVDVAGNKAVYGVRLSDNGTLGSTKYRIDDASIHLQGGDEAALTGYLSERDSGALNYDTVIHLLNVQSEGGKDVYLLHQSGTNDRFTGDITLGSQRAYESAAGTLYAIYGYGSHADSSTNIVDNNTLKAWGKIRAAGSHSINIVTGDSSYMYGDTEIQDTASINLALNGSNSRWDMVADSTLTTLTLNSATLNFMPASATTRTQARNAATFKTLTVSGDYIGNNGNIIMNTQLGDDTSLTDRLIVNGNTSGNTYVTVLNAGGAGGLTTNGIELISVAGNSDGVFTQKGRIVAGAYDYALQRGAGQNDKNWYLTSALSPDPQPEPLDPVDPVVPIDPTDPQTPSPTPRENAVRPEAGLYGMNLQAANTMFNTRLHDRLGETHYVDALTGEKAVTSLWLRNVGGHTRQKDSSGQLEMQANRYVMQLGGDIAQWSSDNTDRFHLGLMAGYANQKARAENQRNGNRADSRISGYSVGLYGTWLQDNATHEGAYVDTWAQYSWFDNTVSGRGVESEEYDSKGSTASVESGYTWKLADISERNALYIQPKAQVTWMGVKADEHREANGTRVTGHGDGNVQTRVGVRLFGKGHNKLDDGKDRTFQPFVEANWIHNSKEFGVSMNGDNVDLDGTRNIGELKAGVEGQLTKNVSLWGNVGQQVGDKGYSDTSAMIGIKASF